MDHLDARYADTPPPNPGRDLPRILKRHNPAGRASMLYEPALAACCWSVDPPDSSLVCRHLPVEHIECVFEDGGMVDGAHAWTWETPTGEILSRAELYRRCALVSARGIPRGTQLDPLCTAAAVVMADDATFDRAPAVLAALGPFRQAYRPDSYDEAAAITTFYRVAAELDEQEALRLTEFADRTGTWPPASPAG